MSKLKTYKVSVVTSDTWQGSVQAASSADAKRLAAEQFKSQERNAEIQHIKIEEARP